MQKQSKNQRCKSERDAKPDVQNPQKNTMLNQNAPSINRQSCNHAKSPFISHNVSKPSFDQKEKSATSPQTVTVLVSWL
jgi:hypothetical protein